MLTQENILQKFDAFRIQHPVGVDPKGLYEPAEYIMSIGGKRLRPFFVIAGYTMFREDYSSAMFAALGVEVFHNFTLLHDDILDAASIRRGKSTVHKLYGENSAILSGDVMMIRSFEYLMSSCPDNRLRDVMKLMLTTASEICEGQQLDMDFEEIHDVSTEQYLQMNNLKTAVLLGACLKLGAMIADAPEQQEDILYDAGISFGKAFQVQDDLLDAYGKTGVTGKKRGGDIVNGKKTFLYTTAIERMTLRRKSSFIEIYHAKAANAEVKIQKVLRVFDEFGVEKIATSYIKSKYAEGVTHIESIDAPMKNKSLLLNYVQTLSQRVL